MTRSSLARRYVCPSRRIFKRPPRPKDIGISGTAAGRQAALPSLFLFFLASPPKNVRILARMISLVSRRRSVRSRAILPPSKLVLLGVSFESLSFLLASFASSSGARAALEMKKRKTSFFAVDSFSRVKSSAT